MPANPALRPIRWVYDKLREAFEPRQTPRSAPTVGVFDPPYRCLIVNQEWASHVMGMIDVLTELDAWAGTEAQQETAIQEVEKLLNALAKGNCDEMAITDIRVNGCDLEVVYNDSGTWVTVGDLTACSVPGEDGREVELSRTYFTTPEPGGANILWRYVGDSSWQILAQIFNGEDGREIELQAVAVSTPCDGQLIQWRYTGDSTWSDLATICDGETGPAGPAGPPGADGQDGLSAEMQYFNDWVQWRLEGGAWVNLYQPCAECAPGSYGPEYPRPDPDPGEDPRCVIAEAYMMGFEDYVAELDALVGDTADVAYILGGMVTLVSILGAVGTSGTSVPASIAAFDLVVTVSAFTYGQIIGAIDSGVKDALKCMVYCNAPADGVYTKDAHDALLAEIDAYPWGNALVSGDRKTIVRWFAEVIGVIGINNEPAVYNVTSGDCTACDPCPGEGSPVQLVGLDITGNGETPLVDLGNNRYEVTFLDLAGLCYAAGFQIASGDINDCFDIINFESGTWGVHGCNSNKEARVARCGQPWENYEQRASNWFVDYYPNGMWQVRLYRDDPGPIIFEVQEYP